MGPISWTRAGSGFTLLFEARAMLLCAAMPVQEAGRLLEEERHPVVAAGEPLRGSGARTAQLGVGAAHPERRTSARPGHRYVTSMVNAETREPLMTEARESAAVEAFVTELRAHGGETRQIELVAMDMRPAYGQGERQ